MRIFCVFLKFYILRTLGNVDVPPLLIAVFALLIYIPCSTPHTHTRLLLKWGEVRSEMNRCLVLFGSYSIILIDIFRISMKYLYNK